MGKWILYYAILIIGGGLAGALINPLWLALLIAFAWGVFGAVVIAPLLWPDTYATMDKQRKRQ